MANLDKLLKKIEKNKEAENEVTVHQLKVGDETYDVTTMTRSQKRDFMYAQGTSQESLTVGEITKKMKPFIYRSLDLKELAVRAKDAGYINAYYDVVEALFEPEQIIEIISFIMEINKIGVKDVEENVETLKKP
jgi:hypothetical protein